MSVAAPETPLRVVLAVEETHLFHAEFVEELIRKTRDHIVGAALIIWTPPKADPLRYLSRNWYRVRPLEAVRLAWGAVPIRGGSVRSVLERHAIPFFEVSGDINLPTYVEPIRALQPDVILSSQAHIFRDELLGLPRICCLNRHASLLPAYAGLWPAFHAYRCGESETGVTIHTIERGIDRGVPLVQWHVPCNDDDTMLGLYKKCFSVSVDAVLEALDRVRAGDLGACATTGSPSYYSFPTGPQWREFRARGGRLA